MLIGAHVSIAGGLEKSIERGEDLGANCIQTFASSPRSYAINSIDEENIKAYKKARKASSIEMHVFHGIYLINLAHEKEEMRQKGIDSLIYYQEVASEIDSMGTVFHVGSHKGNGFETVLDTVTDSVVRVLDKTPKGVRLLLENAAGHKGTIGQTFEELAAIMEGVEKKGGDMEKLGVCIDTQHAFASGYDLRNQEGIDKLIEKIQATVGLDNVSVMHVNDSMTEFDSRRDRHENIGEGEIGDEGFGFLINDSRLAHLPFVLEVPGKNKSGPRKVDVDHLFSLLQ